MNGEEEEAGDAGRMNGDVGARPTVGVLDAVGMHEERINRAVMECGASAHWMKLADEGPGLAGRRGFCPLVLVQFGGEIAPVLASIQSLKRLGFQIAVYGEGIGNYLISSRCLLLLAGASHFLDSAQPHFEKELRGLVEFVLQAESKRAEEEAAMRKTMSGFGLVGDGEQMIGVFRSTLRLAVKSELPILITGETGTGKELVAAAIHQLDPKRRCGPFVPVNCAALLATVAESELFGHRRGAFTGADRDRNGLFRAAKGGILFLDEIGELDLALQGKLLRAIQEKRIVPVGEEREIAVDVRVVAATNRDLAERVQEGKFRLDLFHRLDVGLVHIPPLRERRADFRPLIQFFLEKHSELNGKKFSIGPDFLGALRQLRWPGNVRQLENLVRKVLLEKTSRTPLQLCDLPVAVLQELSRGLPASPLPIESARDRPESENHKAAPPEIEIRWAHLLHTQDNLAGCLESCDRAVVAIALERAHGNQTEAARILGRTGRTIYNKVRKHSLHHLVGKGQNVAA